MKSKKIKKNSLLELIRESGGDESMIEILKVRKKEIEPIEDSIKETYDFLLKRLYNNIPSEKETVFKLPAPKIDILHRKTIFHNFHEISRNLNRNHDHFLCFILNELSTTCSFDADNRLILVGKWKIQMIESIIVKYISEYVACKQCKSMSTTLSRDPISRFYIMSCLKCNASMTVRNIEKGFSAKTRK